MHSKEQPFEVVGQATSHPAVWAQCRAGRTGEAGILCAVPRNTETWTKPAIIPGTPLSSRCTPVQPATAGQVGVHKRE